MYVDWTGSIKQAIPNVDQVASLSFFIEILSLSKNGKYSTLPWYLLALYLRVFDQVDKY